MFSVLFIENDDKDVTYAIQRVRDSGLAPLDMHVILLDDDVGDLDAEEIRKELKLSSVRLIPTNGLKYSTLLSETIDFVSETKPDIVVVDLQLSLHDSTLRLCDLNGPLQDESAFEGVQLTRDLERTGLISWFVWVSNFLEPALDARQGYLCELVDETVILSVPRVSVLDKKNLDRLSRVVRGLAKASSGQLAERKVLYEIPQGSLVKLWTDITDRDYNIKHWLDGSLGLSRMTPDESLRKLRQLLRQLSQATLIPYYVPACRLGSLLRAYNKPWIDDVINMANERSTGVFGWADGHPYISDSRFIAKLATLSDGLRQWLYCAPLPEVLELIDHCLRKSGLEVEVEGRELIEKTDDTLEFGARGLILELLYNVFKNAHEHGMDEKGGDAFCSLSLAEEYLVMEVTNRCIERNKPKREVFNHPPRGIKTMERCIDSLNDGAWATEDADLWWYEMACSLDGAKWPNKVYPARLVGTITELDVADGNWGVRLCFPRRRL